MSIYTNRQREFPVDVLVTGEHGALVTVTHAAEILNKEYHTLDMAIRARGLEVITVGATRLLRLADLERLR